MIWVPGLYLALFALSLAVVLLRSEWQCAERRAQSWEIVAESRSVTAAYRVPGYGQPCEARR
jgi:hypothetical protein